MMIKKELFLRLCEQTFYPDVDLFASYINHQVDRFVSWFPQPGAWHCDTFSFSWNDTLSYIFAPVTLISRILYKIVEDEVEQSFDDNTTLDFSVVVSIAFINVDFFSHQNSQDM